MQYVVCKIDEGLRPSEVTVEIEALGGRSEFLRVDRDYVKKRKNQWYLPIGLVFRNQADDKDIALIELPHEADSGANRLWVDSLALSEEKPTREVVHDPV